MRGKISTILTMIFMGIFMITGCEDTKAEENMPESGQIVGTITFLGDWPVNGQVAVSLNVNWLPTGAPYAFFSITQDDLVNGSYNYDFTDVAFGDYALIVVSWKEPGVDNPETEQHAIGAHSGSLGEFYLDADVISVTQDNNVLVIDFEADFELIN